MLTRRHHQWPYMICQGNSPPLCHLPSSLSGKSSTSNATITGATGVLSSRSISTRTYKSNRPGPDCDHTSFHQMDVPWKPWLWTAGKSPDLHKMPSQPLARPLAGWDCKPILPTTHGKVPMLHRPTDGVLFDGTTHPHDHNSLWTYQTRSSLPHETPCTLCSAPLASCASWLLYPTSKWENTPCQSQYSTLIQPFHIQDIQILLQPVPYNVYPAISQSTTPRLHPPPDRQDADRKS